MDPSEIQAVKQARHLEKNRMMKSLSQEQNFSNKVSLGEKVEPEPRLAVITFHIMFVLNYPTCLIWYTVENSV